VARLLDPRNAFFERGAIQPFIARDSDGGILGRIATLTTEGHINCLLDQLAVWMMRRCKLGRTTAADSTLLDVHYRGRHYEQRCRYYATSDRRSADQRRSEAAKRTPKLTAAVDTRARTPPPAHLSSSRVTPKREQVHPCSTGHRVPTRAGSRDLTACTLMTLNA
jgi:hypothetical protein